MGTIKSTFTPGELIPLKGTWFRVRPSSERILVLEPRSATAGALKNLRGTSRRERRAKWIAAGRKL